MRWVLGVFVLGLACSRVGDRVDLLSPTGGWSGGGYAWEGWPGADADTLVPVGVVLMPPAPITFRFPVVFEGPVVFEDSVTFRMGLVLEGPVVLGDSVSFWDGL